MRALALVLAAALLPGCATTIGGQGSRAGGIQQGSQGATEQRPDPVTPPAPVVVSEGGFPAQIVVGGVAVPVPMSTSDVRQWLGRKLVGSEVYAEPQPTTPREMSAPVSAPEPPPAPTERGATPVVLLNVTGDAWHTFADCRYLRPGFYSVRADRIPPGRTHLCITCARRTP